MSSLWINQVWSQAAAIIFIERVQAIQSRNAYNIFWHGINRVAPEWLNLKKTNVQHSELPETVAKILVPRMRVVKVTGKAIEYLTPPRILLALVSTWVRRGQ